MPAAPLTTAGRAKRGERPALLDRRAGDGGAPTIGARAGRSSPTSWRNTTSGCSTATSASKSPSRAAARNASTSSRWRARSASTAGAPGPGGARGWPSAGPRRASSRGSPRSRRTARRTCRAARRRGARAGVERLEHHEQREADRVGELRLPLRIAVAGSARDERLGQPAPAGPPAARLRAWSMSRATRADDRGQPAARFSMPPASRG